MKSLESGKCLDHFHVLFMLSMDYLDDKKKKNQGHSSHFVFVGNRERLDIDLVEARCQ